MIDLDRAANAADGAANAAPDDIDRAALERCIAAFASRSAANAVEVEGRLAENGWLDTAKHAAYGEQCDNLKLSSHQEPPYIVSADDPHERDKSAQRLLRRLLAANLSRYEPDPRAALRRARKRTSA